MRLPTGRPGVSMLSRNLIVWGATGMLPRGWVAAAAEAAAAAGAGAGAGVPASLAASDVEAMTPTGVLPWRAAGADLDTSLATALVAWRRGLAQGDAVDARDMHHKWYEARVVAVAVDDVRVRFLGWCPRSQPDRYDEWIPRTSHRLLPPGAKIRTWRRVQVGDHIEVRDDRTVDTSRVAAVRPATRQIQMGDGSSWVSVDDIYRVAAADTHRRPREWAEVDWEDRKSVV